MGVDFVDINDIVSDGLLHDDNDRKLIADKFKREGKMTEMSILTEKQDLNAVIDEVKTWDFVDTDKITVMGYSQGGLVAALTAAERDDIHKLLLNYPAFTMVEEIKKEYSSVDQIPDTINRMGMKVGKIYFADILAIDYDVYERAARYNGKILIVHGTADELVPYESSVKAAQVYNCEVFTIDGAGHGFTDTKYDEIFLKKAYSFFNN